MMPGVCLRTTPIFGVIWLDCKTRQGIDFFYMIVCLTFMMIDAVLLAVLLVLVLHPF